MKKKIVSIILAVMVLLISVPKYSFADTKGKVIFISMNRTNLEEMLQIPSLKKELETRGYLSLMNVRGDKGTDDKRSYASMGAGGRANVSDVGYINFREINKQYEEIFKSTTGQVPKQINDITINKSINENTEKGQYGSVLGSLGQTLSENKFEISVIGNSDIIYENKQIYDRSICLTAMDNYGRIDKGNIDNINKEDLSMPFGMSTDYERLLADTKKYYDSSNAVFIDLGDTYRLDQFKSYLNENSYIDMKNRIYSKIDKYIEEVLKMSNESDSIYIVSPFPSNLDYKNKKRLAPVIKFDGEGKGVLTSSTTRREGVIGNVDIGADILNKYELKNKFMVGRALTEIDRDDNIEFLSNEMEKMISISQIRANLVNSFVAVVSISWVLGVIAILFKKYIPNKYKVFTVIKEFIKLGIIMPLALLIAPIFNFTTPEMIVLGVIGTTILLYILGRLLFKDDIKQMGFFAGLTILIIVIDSIFGTYLMKNNVMSYDAIVGARYYGIGNEYEGVTIASAVFAMAVFLNYKSIPKWIVAVISLVILITSAYPGMGANVGGAISESVAYLLFILLIFDVKLDFKKVILLGIFAVLVVVAFAVVDIVSGSESHLSVFVNQILVNGPGAIIQTFARKIAMNMKLAQTSVWVNILLAGIFIIGIFIFKPSKQTMKISKRYPVIYKGFIASMVGCIVTLLVNDSGIVAASTASIYILIPLIIISINMVIFENKG